ncbi:predicted protein [Phaeodactylum tricornutum CCAP 1055/1]|jgi:hypothetical protein|uniref:Uncharacterized protein n=2 Tax=Phaeodactylum tricornutum TaxID=2850 RepID=B7FUQ1_PHATC|nr:predicted protein [Phaeodactylum tricornutum CCAP 1055/1]EEC50023.1 predicted protein [Phaeodactylum tricornutum CCAP 1055/1]|eukprot:XP_002178358.1 predicted protein [Phaeodactylum tricornutum CCAP 1055/1]
MLLLRNLLPGLALLTLTSEAFCTRSKRDHRVLTTRTFAVIKPEEADFNFDVGQGGVRLASESAIKITGTVKHNPGSAEPTVTDLIRYTSLSQVEDKYVQEVLSKIGAKIVGTGRGKEDYREPGETTDKIVIQSPSDAVRDALMGVGSAMEADKIVINFLGGDDLQVLEVLDAVQMMVLDLDIATKARVQFHSVAHSSVPMSSATITVVSLPEGVSLDELSGIEKAVTSGEVYFRDGHWWTTEEENINAAIA